MDQTVETIIIRTLKHENAALRGDKEILSRSNRDLDREIKDLHKNVEELRRKLELNRGKKKRVLEAENDAFCSQNMAFHEDNEALHKDMEALKKQKEDQQTKFEIEKKTWQQELEQLTLNSKAEKEVIEVENETLKHEVQILLRENQTLEEKVNIFRETNTRTEKERDALRNQNYELQIDILQIQKNLQQEVTKCEGLQDYDTLKQENESLNKYNMTLEQELQEVKKLSYDAKEVLKRKDEAPPKQSQAVENVLHKLKVDEHNYNIETLNVRKTELLEKLKEEKKKLTEEEGARKGKNEALAETFQELQDFLEELEVLNCNYDMMMQEESLQNMSLSQDLQETKKKLLDGEEALRQNNQALQEQVHAFNNVQQVVKDYEIRIDIICRESMIVKQQKETLEQELQETKDVKQKNEALQEEVQKLKDLVEELKVLQCNYNTEMQDKSLQNMSLEQDLQETKKKLLDREEALRQNNQALQEQVQAFNNVQQVVKDYDIRFDIVCRESMIVKQQEESLEQELQEMKKRLVDEEKAMRQENEALQEEVQELKDILKELKVLNCNYDIMMQDKSLQNMSLEQDLQETKKKLLDGEEASRQNNQALQEQVQAFNNVQQVVKDYEIRFDIICRESMIVKQQKESLEQELQETKDVRQKNEALQEEVQKLKDLVEELKVLQCKYNTEMQDKSLQNMSLEQDLQETKKKLLDGEEASRQNNQALQEQVQAFNNVQQVVKDYEIRYDIICRESMIVKQQKETLEQELQETKDVKQKNEALQEEVQKLKDLVEELKVLQCNYNTEMQDKSLQNMSLEQDLQETKKKLLDREKAMRQENGALQEEVQEFKDILKELKVLNCNYDTMMQDKSLQNMSLEQDLQETKKKLLDREEALRQNNQALQEQVQAFNNVQQVVKDYGIRFDIICRESMIVKQQKESLEQELQENKDVRQKNEALQEEVQKLKDLVEELKVLQCNYNTEMQDKSLRNMSLEQDLQETKKKLLDGEEASRQNNQALQEQVQAFNNVQQVVKDYEIRFDIICRESMIVKQQKESLEQELQETKDVRQKNEALQEEVQKLKDLVEELKVLQCNYNTEMQDKSLQNMSLEQDLQETKKKLLDREEAMRQEHEALQEEVQEFKDILKELKVFQCNYNSVTHRNESLSQQNDALQQQLEEIKKMLTLEKGFFASEQIKACQREDAFRDELQTLQILQRLKMEQIEALQTEVLALTIKTVADQLNADEHKTASGQQKCTTRWLPGCFS
uniref:interaptin-like n=1 Tax=Semicossyphus pulcher TaxID=241346 RepID=UPI0037E975C1